MKDKNGVELAVGDLIEVLEIFDGLRQVLGEEDYRQVLTMKGMKLEVEEITDDGYATVGLWVNESDGKNAYHGLSLLPHECQRVEWTIDALRLHDMTLGDIDLRWGAGTAAIKFIRHELPCRLLTFTGVTSLTVSREFPWGPSRSVNSIRASSEAGFEIEMQSGDIIAVGPRIGLLRLTVTHLAKTSNEI
jgi:hypothetical protein